MMRTLLNILLLLPLGTFGVSKHDIVKREAGHDDWSYKDPGSWYHKHEMCNDKRQSPINIMNGDVDYDDELDAFKFHNYDDDLDDATIENNGHTVVITPNPRDVPRTFDEGGEDDKYQFIQLHFHWGANSKRGSEHQIDGQKFPMEMHIVHKNTVYKNQTYVNLKEDGLAVLAVLFKLSDKDNEDLKPIIDKLDDIPEEDDDVKIDNINLDDLLPDDLMPYYRYKGSLTTPPCSENVIWTVFKHPVPISEKQLEEFRNLKFDEGSSKKPLVDNFRPPQKLQGRVVEVSGEGNAADIIGPSIIMILTAISFLL